MRTRRPSSAGRKVKVFKYKICSDLNYYKSAAGRFHEVRNFIKIKLPNMFGILKAFYIYSTICINMEKP